VTTMAEPGWPKADTIPEATAIQIDADSSHHGSYHGSHRGSHHGSRHGSRQGSQHGASNYAQALQISRDAAAAKLERRTSRRTENLAAGTNDYDQDYAGDYPIERDTQAQQTKTLNYDPRYIVVAYFKKWIGGIDDVRATNVIVQQYHRNFQLVHHASCYSSHLLDDWHAPSCVVRHAGLAHSSHL